MSVNQQLSWVQVYDAVSDTTKLQTFLRENPSRLIQIPEFTHKNQKKIKASFSNNILHVALLKFGQHSGDVVKALLEHDINFIHHKNTNGTAPLDLIKSLNNAEITNLISKNAENSKDTKEKIFDSAKDKNEELFLELIQEEFVNACDGKDESSSSCTLLELCCFNGLPKCVSYLLNNGANVNKSVLPKNSPLKLALENNHEEVVEMLVNRFDLKLPSDILFTVIKSFINVEDAAESIDKYMEIILPKFWDEFCTESAEILNEQDDLKRTVLHYSSACNASRTVEMLVNMGASLFVEDSELQGPLHYMSCNQFERFLNGCVQHRSDEIKLEINYKKLIGVEEKEESRGRELEVLLYMLENEELQEAFSHPVISIYVELRWRKIFYWFCLMPLLFYCIAYFSLCFYGFLFAQHNEVSNVLITFSLGLMVLQEILNFTVIYGRRYFQKIDFWIDLVMITGKIYILAAGWLEKTLSKNLVIAYSVILLTSTLGIFLQLAKFRLLTYKIKMFRVITVSFLKYALFYTFPLFAFLLCFFMLSDEREDDFFLTMYEIFTMFGGDGNADYPDQKFTANPIFGHIIYIVFALLIGIVLQNLLTGLAIKDMESVQAEESFLVERERAKFIVDLEEINLLSRKDQTALVKCTFYILSAVLRKSFVFQRVQEEAKIFVREDRVMCFTTKGGKNLEHGRLEKEAYKRLINLQFEKFEQKQA